MKFWVKFSRIIFRLVASPWLKKAQKKSIESVLLKSIGLLEVDMLGEMRSFIRLKQTKQGGFADRAGQCDLYYSLFGYFVAEAISVADVKASLKDYVKRTVIENSLTGIHLYCGVILYAKLWGFDSISENLKKQVVAELQKVNKQQSVYTNFLGVLALYYLEDFRSIRRIINSYKSYSFQKELPCPVVAATAILLDITGKRDPSVEDKLKSFYRGKGGFAALMNAPAEDILSTAVALYALNFIDSDIRMIKPDCLTFLDELYYNGGFRTMPIDFETDVEYTFYGLLALGSLNK